MSDNLLNTFNKSKFTIEFTEIDDEMEYVYSFEGVNLGHLYQAIKVILDKIESGELSNSEEIITKE